MINEINHEEKKKKRKYIRNKQININKPKSKTNNKDHEIKVLKGPIYIFGGLF